MLTVPDARNRTPIVALVGNPNSGKTSIFNALTGARQKIGNYPGVTVEKVSGTFQVGDSTIECVDVPGLYSMTAVSADEAVAAAVIETIGQETSPDVLVAVLDASNLERNLFFYSQIAESGIPIVVVLTMTDVLEKEGKTLDLSALEKRLGTGTTSVVAHKNSGVAELKEAIDLALKERPAPELEIGYPEIVTRAVNEIQIEFPHLSDKSVRRALLLDSQDGLTAEESAAIDRARKALLGESAQGKTIDAQARYAWAGSVCRETVKTVRQVTKTATERLDWFFTHRFFGLLAFIVVMYLVFQSIYTLAEPLMGWIESGIEWTKGIVGPIFDSTPTLQSLILDGVIGGIGAVLVFLPQICILFFFIAVLEGTGYLGRAAFLMDRLLGWCGLNGRAFIPLLSSFACAVPGIMAARVMPDAKSRLATIMVAPLMSCSARLPVYVLLIGAFIEPKYGATWAGFALFLMHFVGLFVAIPVMLILNKGILKGKRLPFTLELPRYQSPRWKDVGISVYTRGRMFLQTAGTIIFAMSILIWALLYFPRSDAAFDSYRADYSRLSVVQQGQFSEENYVAQRQLRDSYLGKFGRAIEPVFVPAGFDWRLTTGILAAFPAREVVIPALGIIFSLGGDVDEGSSDLRKALEGAKWPDGRPLMTPWNAVSMMVFFALCCQCMATLATIRRETNSWKWPTAAFVYMTALAYLAAALITWVGGLLS